MGLTDDFTTNKYSLKCVNVTTVITIRGFLHKWTKNEMLSLYEVRFLLKWKVYKYIQTIL
jgi:hypothetical protein